MRKKWHITLLLGIIGILLLTLIFIITTNITFKLNGSSTEKIQVGAKYKDDGATALLFKKDISDKIITNSNLNTDKIGRYNVNYELSIIGKKYYLNRKIEVIDNTKPDIKLNGQEEITIYTNEEYEDQGATAIDNYDGDITSNIIINNTLDSTKEGEYIITYTVKDSSNNSNEINRKIIVKKKEEINTNKILKQSNIQNNINVNHPIIKYIIENNYDVSIGYYNLLNGDSLYYKENELYYGASLIKTLDALYLYDNNLVTEDIKTHINKAISVSDNDSHYNLVNYIGKNNLKNYGISLGAPNTLSGGDLYGNTTVLDQMAYLKKLYILSNGNEELKSFFINNYGNYLRVDNVKIMHKYGYYGTYYHDVGIFFTDKPYILVVLTRHGSNNEKEVINNISKKVYEYYK